MSVSFGEGGSAARVKPEVQTTIVSKAMAKAFNLILTFGFRKFLTFRLLRFSMSLHKAAAPLLSLHLSCLVPIYKRPVRDRDWCCQPFLCGSTLMHSILITGIAQLYSSSSTPISAAWSGS
jgi:hypothetical protein